MEATFKNALNALGAPRLSRTTIIVSLRPRQVQGGWPQRIPRAFNLSRCPATAGDHYYSNSSCEIPYSIATEVA